MRSSTPSDEAQPGTKLVLLAYLVVFTFALGSVWVFHRVNPLVLRAIQHLSLEPEAYPAGLRLFLGLEAYLPIIPALVFLTGLLSWKISPLRHPITLSLLSCLVGAFFVVGGLLMATPLLAYAGLPSFTPEVKRQIQDAEKMTVYAIDPMDNTASEKFHSYSISGKTIITDPAKIKELGDKLIAASSKNKGVETLCFNPHHALRITSHGKALDLVICFQCLKVQLHPGEDIYFMNSSPRELVNEILLQAGIKPTDDSPESK